MQNGTHNVTWAFGCDFSGKAFRAKTFSCGTRDESRSEAIFYESRKRNTLRQKPSPDSVFMEIKKDLIFTFFFLSPFEKSIYFH